MDIDVYYIDGGERFKFPSERKRIIHCEIINDDFTLGSDTTIDVVNAVAKKTSRSIGMTVYSSSNSV